MCMEWLLRGGMRCGASGFTGGGLSLLIIGSISDVQWTRNNYVVNKFVHALIMK